MLKRTKGRILLTMLVITGLAGTINNTTLSNQERKFAISQLKDTRTDLLSTIKNLSGKQLNFKPSPEKWSITECISHISLTEKMVWNKVEIAMKQPSTPEKRLELPLSDQDLLKDTDGRITYVMVPRCHLPQKESSLSATEAVSDFKAFRAVHLKYVKTTTEDLRNHFIQLPVGWVDCYQAIVFMSGHSNGHINQINEILTHPDFPKK